MAPRDYERIWLTGDGFSEEGVAWCDERIEDDDVEYVNARLFNALAAHAEELTVALHALVDARDGEEPGICRGDANVVGGNNIYEECNCVYGCETTVDTTGDLLREIHAPDCPISLARAALEHKEV